MHDERSIAQKRVTLRQTQGLLRVIYEETETHYVVVTAYFTSDIARYWGETPLVSKWKLFPRFEQPKNKLHLPKLPQRLIQYNRRSIGQIQTPDILAFHWNGVESIR